MGYLLVQVDCLGYLLDNVEQVQDVVAQQLLLVARHGSVGVAVLLGHVVLHSRQDHYHQLIGLARNQLQQLG